jgi:hypothetical protein
MQTLANDARSGFGWMIDLACTGPAAVGKHGRSVVVMTVIEECAQLRALNGELRPASIAERTTNGPRNKDDG